MADISKAKRWILMTLLYCGPFRHLNQGDQVYLLIINQEAAIQSPELTPSEKGMIKQHLRRLRNQTEKPLVTPVGYQGRYMEPTMIQELNLQSATSKSHLDTSVIALCLPYFLLDEYSSNSEVPKSAKHPTRTLLQSSISTTAQERDMRQAVCKLSVKQTGYCFHVSQLWCLILNDSE